MGITSNFANVATVTRASAKTDAGGWDFTNGGTVGTLTEYASGVAAIHATAGLLVEEITTNEIRNPRCEGAVAGTPGTMPTNWLVGAVTEVVGSGQEDGWPYVDVRYAATPGANVSLLTLESSFVTSSPAGAGVDWALSAGIRVVAGSTANINGFRLRLFQFSTVPAFLGAVQGPQFLPDAQHKRFYGVITTADASTDSVRPEIVLETSGGAIDITLRIYAPQLEQKAYPTSPVFPVVSSPAAATRAADVITVPNGAWEKSGSGFSCYIEMTTLGSSDGVSLALGPDNNNRLGIEGDGFVFLNTGASTLLNSAYGGDTSAGANIKVAARLADANYAVSRSTVAQLTASTGNATQYGGGTSTGRSPGGGALTVQGFYIKDIRYWPKALTNAELEALVGN